MKHGIAGRLVLKDRDVSKVFIIALGFALGGLMFFSQMATARFVSQQRVAAHQFAKLKKVSDSTGMFQRLIQF